MEMKIERGGTGARPSNTGTTWEQDWEKHLSKFSTKVNKISKAYQIKSTPKLDVNFDLKQPEINTNRTWEGREGHGTTLGAKSEGQEAGSDRSDTGTTWERRWSDMGTTSGATGVTWERHECRERIGIGTRHNNSNETKNNRCVKLNVRL